METPATLDKQDTNTVRRRISPAIRQAILSYLREGLSKTDAAKRAGISPGHLYNAEMRPHVKTFIEEEKAKLINGVEAMKQAYRAQAYDVAKELMYTAKSENVKMRAVEFLAGEKAGGVNVAVQVNNQMGKAYDFARPDQEVVTIRPAEGSE